MIGLKLAFCSTLLLACGIHLALSQGINDGLFPWQDIINAVDIPEFWPIDINLPSIGNIPAFEIGACGRPPTVPDFNVTGFLGNWYAQRQTASSFQVGVAIGYPSFPSSYLNKLLCWVKIAQ